MEQSSSLKTLDSCTTVGREKGQRWAETESNQEGTRQDEIKFLRDSPLLHPAIELVRSSLQLQLWREFGPTKRKRIGAGSQRPTVGRAVLTLY